MDVGYDRRDVGAGAGDELHAGVGEPGAPPSEVEFVGDTAAGIDVGVNVGVDPAVTEQFDQPSKFGYRVVGCPRLIALSFALVEVVSRSWREDRRR